MEGGAAEDASRPGKGRLRSFMCRSSCNRREETRKSAGVGAASTRHKNTHEHRICGERTSRDSAFALSGRWEVSTCADGDDPSAFAHQKPQPPRWGFWLYTSSRHFIGTPSTESTWPMPLRNIRCPGSE